MAHQNTARTNHCENGLNIFRASQETPGDANPESEPVSTPCSSPPSCRFARGRAPKFLASLPASFLGTLPACPPRH